MTPDRVRHPAVGPAERKRLILRVSSALDALIRLGYFSFELEGGDRIPRDGAVVYAQNHAGWFALDTFLVGYAVEQALGKPAGLARVPYFAAHDSALAAPGLGPFLRGLGGLPASWFLHPERLPPDIECFGICPEGVRGNTKPFWEAYRMRPWSRAFVRLAIAREARIVPVAVLGGEECLPVGWTVRILEPLIGSIIGMPVLPVPLPTRWKVVFHEPFRVASPRRARPDPALCDEFAARTQAIVQATLDREARARPLGRFSTLVSALRHEAMKRAPEADDDADPLLDEGPSPPAS